MKGIVFSQAYMSFLAIMTTVSANMYTKRVVGKDNETRLKIRNL